MNHCRQRKPDPSKQWLSKLPQLAHRLEESLYRSAPSFEAYNDISTLKQRLEQLAINVGMKTKRIQQAAQQPGGQRAQPSTHQQSDEVYNPMKKKKKLSSIAARAMAALEDKDDIIELSSNDEDEDEPIDTSKGLHKLLWEKQWNDMFQCLLHYIEETRKERTQHIYDDEKKAWVWDGKVPQNYKTPSGKALGTWVTNQRVAKKKGALKDDREARLTNIGLRWGDWNSVSTLDTTNAITNTQEKCNHPGGCLYPAIEGKGLCLNHYEPPQPAARQQSHPKPSFNGGWQSDGDMEDRRRMITNM